MKKIANFEGFLNENNTTKVEETKKEKVEEKVYTEITERKVGWGEVVRIQREVDAYMKKQRANMGTFFGPKSEEGIKSRALKKFGNNSIAREYIETGTVAPGPAPSDWDRRGDGMRHDNEPGKSHDAFNTDSRRVSMSGVV